MPTPTPTESEHSAARALEASVWRDIERKDVGQAIANCERLTRDHPTFASGWHTASQLAMKLNRPAAALRAIEQAVRLEPDNTAWLVQQALCENRLGRMERLPELVAALLSRKLETAYKLSSVGLLLTQLGRREEAIDYYERAAQLQPDNSKHYYNVACLQRTLGLTEAAERNFDRTLDLDPTDYESLKLRSELRRQTPDNNHVAELEQRLQQEPDEKKGVTNICYALAKELEDLEEYERSFAYLKRGADTKRRYMRYDVERDLQTIEAIRDTFSADLVGEKSGSGSDNDEAIFVVGLPRTGTTLVERILASHPAVESAGELTHFAVEMTRLVKASAGNRKPDRSELVRLSTGIDFRELGDAYIKSTRPFTGNTPRFIDKLPLNYLYVGLIHLALPHAKIVFLERNPMDTCYAIYKQLFTDAYPFSYDLDELAHYYLAYRRLVDHWYRVLPNALHTVRYESLVENLEHEARALIEYCDLAWDPGCLSFHENTTASTTASATQVRQPVYTSSVGKWQHYRQQLAPVEQSLTAAGIPIE